MLNKHHHLYKKRETYLIFTWKNTKEAANTDCLSEKETAGWGKDRDFLLYTVL